MRRMRGMELGREKREADGESPDKGQSKRHQRTVYWEHQYNAIYSITFSCGFLTCIFFKIHLANIVVSRVVSPSTAESGMREGPYPDLRFVFI